jgi:hypothetical protein
MNVCGAVSTNPVYCTRPAATPARITGFCLLVGALISPGIAQADPPVGGVGSRPPATVPAVLAPAWRDPASGVDVYTGADPSMFPAEWLAPTIAASAQPLASSEAERALRLVKVALSKYPVGLIRLNLERIYLVGDLLFQGIAAAGTNSDGRLYLRIDAGNPLYTDATIEANLHHELAHILRRNYAFLWNDTVWAGCNPSGFRYVASSGVEAVRVGRASQLPADPVNDQGFWSEYAASDLSEDFATVGGELMAGDAEFWARVDRFPALRAKVGTAIDFYSQLDERFSEAYFRGLRPHTAYLPVPDDVVSGETPTSP